MSTVTGRLNWPFAATWAACTCIGWLIAAWLNTSQASTANYLLAGIFAQIVTLGLRWQLITGSAGPGNLTENSETTSNWFSQAAGADRELTWILCWVSLCYTLGIIQLGSGWAVALYLGLATAVSEILLLRFAPQEWNRVLPKWWPAEFRPIQTERPTYSPDSFPLSPLDEMVEDSDTQAEFESEKLSATFHGQTDDGQPYLQGWQRYELAAGQKSSSLTIGFFPPFTTAPDCELDHEGDEEVRYEIEHLTPAGARVILKRRSAGESASGKLLWHCSAQ